MDEPWRDMAQTVTRRNASSGAPASLTSAAVGTYHADLNVVVFGLWWGGSADDPFPRTLYVFDAATGRHCGRWQIGNANLEDEEAGSGVLGMAPLKDSDGRYSLGLVVTIGDVDAAAVLRRLSLLSDGNFTDSMDNTTADSASSRYAVSAVRTHMLGDDPSTRVIIDRVTTEHPWDADDAGDSVKLKYHTPTLSASSQLTATLRVAGDRDEGSHARATFGLGQNAQGRWVRITSSSAFAAESTPTSNVQFGFERITAFGQIVPDMDEY
jgi:hypothetical protein